MNRLLDGCTIILGGDSVMPGLKDACHHRHSRIEHICDRLLFHITNILDFQYVA
jgi:hypothetical protein